MSNHKTITNDRLQQIAQEAATKLPELIGEREKDILKDYHNAVEDAHNNGDEKIPKLKLGFALDYDLQTGMLDVALKWTVTRKESDSVLLEDPDQTKRNLGGAK